MTMCLRLPELIPESHGVREKRDADSAGSTCVDADNPRKSSDLHWCCTSRAPDLHRHSSRLQHARGLFSKLSSHARARIPSAHRCALRASCFLEVHGSGFRRRDRGATRAHAATVIVSYQVLSRRTVLDTVRCR